MIGSTSNKQVKRVVNLRAKAKARREENCYVAEGLRMCRELSPDQVEMLYVTEDFGSVPGNRRWLAGFPHETVSDVVMNYMADTKTPQGVLAVVKQRHYRLEELLPQAGKQALKTSAPSGKNPPAPACLMILETLQDPGNLDVYKRQAENQPAQLSGVL